MWRKRRLRLAEAAAYHRGLGSIASRRDTVTAALAHLIAGQPIEQVLDAIQATPKKTDEQMRALEADERMTDQALKILRTGKSDAYGQARAALPKDKQKWRQECERPAADNDDGQSKLGDDGEEDLDDDIPF
jgi:hypothetical protein